MAERGFKVYNTGGTPRLVYEVKPEATWNIGGTKGGETFAQTPMERFREQYLTGMSGQPFYSGGMTASERKNIFGDPTAEGYEAANQLDIGGGLADMLNNLGYGSGGVSSADALALQKYKDERADRAAQQRALQEYLTSGRLDGMSAAEKSDVESQYQKALANIAAGYGAAQELTGTGYGALEKYLTENRVNPYAGMTVDAGLATNPMEQFLQAYGAASPDVQAQVAAEQAARESGAGAFRNLIDVLSGAATQAQSSREAEVQMARNIAEQLLGQQRAGFESQSASARQAALAEIGKRQADREYAIQQALLELGVNPADSGGGAGGETGGDTGGAGMTRDERIQQIAAGAAGIKDAARQFAPKFMQDNPNATAAEIRKKFPKLAEAVSAAKKK